MPLPTAPPFLTLITATFRRPQALAACLQSVGRQTEADQLEQLVVPDHVGYGVAGALFGRLPWIAPAVRGEYVNLLCDDDVLADERAVAMVRTFARARHNPPVIIARVRKNGLALPAGDPEGEPVCGAVDLTSYIVRRDIWEQYRDRYALCYEGDYWFAQALWDAGIPSAFCDVLWAVGAASNGRPEVAA